MDIIKLRGMHRLGFAGENSGHSIHLFHLVQRRFSIKSRHIHFNHLFGLVSAHGKETTW